MSSNIVHQYVWRDYSVSAYRGWILTLKDNEAIAFLAMVTTIVAYTQGRSWILLHDIFNKLTANSVGFEISRKRMSQSEAMRAFSRVRPPTEFPEISPLIGVIAMANIILFVGLGIFLPYNLSGGMETPIVRSRETESCIGMESSWDMKRNNVQMADLFYQRCWYNMSEPSGSCGRPDGFLNDRPKLWVSQQNECLFLGNSCNNRTRGLRLANIQVEICQRKVNGDSVVQPDNV